VFDVIIIGAGPAGLSAALPLGRQHRETLVIDSGKPRNAPADHMHMYLSRDGFPPAELRAAGRAELAVYPAVEIRAGLVESVSGQIGEFTVRLADGTTERGRRIVLATGLLDLLPRIEGLAERFGKGVYHCPFCHGHEATGKAIGVLGGDFPQAMLALYLRDRFSEDVVLCSDGPLTVTPELRAALNSAGIVVRAEAIARIDGDQDSPTVHFASGEPVTRGAIFHRPGARQHSTLAAELGCELMPEGCVRVDGTQQTTVPGVYAAGDMARLAELAGPTPFVITAAGDGARAAIWLEQDLFRASAGVRIPAAK
jgi:thioredoxin reductase